MQELNLEELTMVNGGMRIIGQVADSLAAASIPAALLGPEASAACLAGAALFYFGNAFFG